jgi:hemoglobin
LKSHQRAFIAAAIGGPEIYTGRRSTVVGTWPQLTSLGITNQDFDAVVGHLVATLDIGSALVPLRAEIVAVPVS